MDPRLTAVDRPIQLRIADDLRMRIESGDLRPGDPLPTLQELTAQWHCGMNTARNAIDLLRKQGLITGKGQRGKPPTVRIPPARAVRSSERHQAEKDLVLAPEEVRKGLGEAEINLETPIDHLEFHTEYSVIPAVPDIATALGVNDGTDVLRRTYGTTDPKSGHRRTWSVSHIPRSLIEANPRLLDAKEEPWPGGTQHQLYTVGIEIDRMVDEVTAYMPTTVDMQLWGLPDGVPMIRVRRISIDTQERVVEISDAEYPADRTELLFITPLTRWSKEH